MKFRKCLREWWLMKVYKKLFPSQEVVYVELEPDDIFKRLDENVKGGLVTNGS